MATQSIFGTAYVGGLETNSDGTVEIKHLRVTNTIVENTVLKKEIGDPLITLNSGAIDDSKNIGICAKHTNDTLITGLVRNSSDKKYYLLSDTTIDPAHDSDVISSFANVADIVVGDVNATTLTVGGFALSTDKIENKTGGTTQVITSDSNTIEQKIAGIQKILTDATETKLSQPLNMGGNDISNVNLVDGYNLDIFDIDINLNTTHRQDDTKHRLIDDITPSATTLYSGNKIDTELGTKLDTSVFDVHQHVVADITDFPVINPADRITDLITGTTNIITYNTPEIKYTLNGALKLTHTETEWKITDTKVNSIGGVAQSTSGKLSWSATNKSTLITTPTASGNSLGLISVAPTGGANQNHGICTNEPIPLNGNIDIRVLITIGAGQGVITLKTAQDVENHDWTNSNLSALANIRTYVRWNKSLFYTYNMTTTAGVNVADTTSPMVVYFKFRRNVLIVETESKGVLETDTIPIGSYDNEGYFLCVSSYATGPSNMTFDAYVDKWEENIGISSDVAVSAPIGYLTNLDITGTTESIGTKSGALTVAGGAGIVGNLSVGGSLNVAGLTYEFPTEHKIQAVLTNTKTATDPAGTLSWEYAPAFDQTLTSTDDTTFAGIVLTGSQTLTVPQIQWGDGHPDYAAYLNGRLVMSRTANLKQTIWSTTETHLKASSFLVKINIDQFSLGSFGAYFGISSKSIGSLGAPDYQLSTAYYGSFLRMSGGECRFARQEGWGSGGLTLLTQTTGLNLTTPGGYMWIDYDGGSNVVKLYINRAVGDTSGQVGSSAYMTESNWLHSSLPTTGLSFYMYIASTVGVQSFNMNFDTTQYAGATCDGCALVCSGDASITGDLKVSGAIDLTTATFSGLDTDDVAEGSNLYYTTGRFDTDLATKTTDNLLESATKKYISPTSLTQISTNVSLISSNASSISTNSTNISNRVIGPGSSTDDAICRFDSTTGKLVQNSTVLLTDTAVMTIPSGGGLTLSSGADFKFECGNFEWFDVNTTATFADTVFGGAGSLKVNHKNVSQNVAPVGFTVSLGANAGTVEYTSTRSRRVHSGCTISYSCDTKSTIVEFYLAKDTSPAYAGYTEVVGSRVKMIYASNGFTEPNSTAIHSFLQPSTGDRYQLWCEVSGACTVRVEYVNCFGHTLPNST